MLAAVQVIEDPIWVLVGVGKEKGSTQAAGRPHPTLDQRGDYDRLGVGEKERHRD